MIDAEHNEYTVDTFIEAAVLEYVERVRRRRAIFAQMTEASRAKDDDLTRTLSYQYEIESVRGDLVAIVAWLLDYIGDFPIEMHYTAVGAIPEIVEALRDDEYLDGMIEGVARSRDIDITTTTEGTPE